MNVGFAVAFFSRAKWSERLIGLIGLIGLGGLAVIAVSALLAIDKSMRGMTIPLCVIPVGVAAVCVAYCTGRQVSKSSNAPTKSGDLWKIDTAWNSRDPKPDFNDMVEYQGVVYGFDASIFGCISLETGKRLWKKGRYGTGQVVGNRVYARNSQEAACFTFETH